MSKRCVWVVEGRRKNRPREQWRVNYAQWSQRCAFNSLQLYRDNNQRHEFRVTKYVPEKP